MSDGAISQAEIDALLSGVDMGGLSAGGSSMIVPNVNIDTTILTGFADEVKENLAQSLKTMTGKEVIADVPMVEALGRDQVLAKIPEVVVAVMADFNATLNGDHLFIFSPEFAQKLIGLINKEDEPELSEMGLSIISEVVAQHSGSEITALTKDGKLSGLAANAPEAVHQPKPMVRMPQGIFALFTYPVTVDGEPYTLWEAVSGSVAEGMAKALGGNSGSDFGTGALNSADLASMGNLAGGNPMGGMMNNPMGGAQNNMNMGAMMGSPMGGMNMAGMNMGAPMGGMNQMGGQMMPQGGGMQFNTPNVQSLQFPNLANGIPSSEQGNIGLIMDVYMEMTVELGHCKKTIKEILGMGEGTIIELDKLAGEAVDILVNHKPIAKGEVVVIDENFGVRVTEILPAIQQVSSSM